MVEIPVQLHLELEVNLLVHNVIEREIKREKVQMKPLQTFCLCITTEIELSYRILLSIHSIIAVSVYPSLINSWPELRLNTLQQDI